MPNTYTQLHIHIVFAVSNRNNLISPEWSNELHLYMVGIINKLGHKSLIVNSMPDHIHILLGLKPEQSLSALVQTVKGFSSRWINERGFLNNHFSWQKGYGAFSHSHSAIKTVCQYIQNQQVHHKRKSFIEEYEQMLRLYNIPYDKKYVFASV